MMLHKKESSQCKDHLKRLTSPKLVLSIDKEQKLYVFQLNKRINGCLPTNCGVCNLQHGYFAGEEVKLNRKYYCYKCPKRMISHIWKFEETFWENFAHFSWIFPLFSIEKILWTVLHLFIEWSDIVNRLFLKNRLTSIKNMLYF